jgi:hypothetical protein
VSRLPGTYARIAELPLEIEDYRLERLEAPVTRDFIRVTTLVRLVGGGEEGLGEDVTWYAEAHDRELAAGPSRPLSGAWTLESFSSALEIEEPHKRWAYESAALDLALRQAGRSLAEALGRTPRPVTFVVSPGLGDPPSPEPLQRRLELYPELRFKLDPGSGWTDELVQELAATGTVDIVDYKAFYSDPDAPPPDVQLYRRVAQGFPEAWLEDPALTVETEEILRPHHDRIT